MNRIKTLRKMANMSQDFLAAAMNVTQTSVSQWETGRTYPDMETTIRLSKYFGVSTDYLLGLSDSTDEKKPASDEAGLSDDRLIARYGEVKEYLSEDDIDDIELFIRIKAERKKKKESERE